jgi:hypothetical protein
MIQRLGLRVQGSGFRVPRFEGKGLGFEVLCFRFRGSGSTFHDLFLLDLRIEV